MEIKKTPKANLENKKFLFREIGLIVALLLVYALFEHKTYDKKIETLTDNTTAVAEEEIISTAQQEPPPVEMVKAPELLDAINVVDDNVKLDNELIISTEDDKNLGVQIMDYVQGTGGGKEEEVVEEDIPAAVVEQKPTFMGGDENDYGNWVKSKFVYPDVAAENGIQGKVYVQFVVDAEGRVVNVQIVRSIDASIDKELLRVMAMSPKWTPGKQRGKAVRVKYTLPINLQLR